MTVSDTWSDWSTTAASNSPPGTATPEIDDELRNIKAEVKANAVALSGNQTVAGVKTFSAFPVTPSAAPSTDYQAANKKYVDDTAATAESSAVSSASALAVLLTGNQSIDGVKTFTSIPVLPASDPTLDDQAARKAYVDAQITAATGGNLNSGQYMKYSDHKSNNTNGGSSVSGGWYTRDLNTEDNDAGNIGSIASNKVTLPAGTYYAIASAPFNNSAQVRLRLYNVTDASSILTGGNTSVYLTEEGLARLSGLFTLAAPKDISVQYRVTTSTLNFGLGSAANFGEDEIYTILELWKVA